MSRRRHRCGDPSQVCRGARTRPAVVRRATWCYRRLRVVFVSRCQRDGQPTGGIDQRLKPSACALGMCQERADHPLRSPPRSLPWHISHRATRRSLASPSPFSCLPLANRPIRVRCPGRRRRGSLSAQVLGPRARWPSTWRTQMRLQERRLSSCSRPQAYATSPTHSGPPRSRRHLPSSRRRPTSQTPRRCCVGSRRTLCHLRERLDNSVSVSGVHRRCNGRYGRPGAAMGGKAGRLDMLGGTVELAALTGAPIPPQPASAGSRPMSDRCSSRLVET